MLNNAQKSYPNGLTLRAWVHFRTANLSAVVMVSSFNVTSITRAGAALYNVTFTNAMPSSDYIMLIEKLTDTAALTKDSFYAAAANKLAASCQVGCASDSTGNIYLEFWA